MNKFIHATLKKKTLKCKCGSKNINFICAFKILNAMFTQCNKCKRIAMLELDTSLLDINK